MFTFSHVSLEEGKGKRFTCEGEGVDRYLPVHIGSHLIDNGLGAIAEEIIGIGHIVHIQTNAGLYRWLCPPIEGLRTGSQSYHTIHNHIDQCGELTGNQNAADYQNRRNSNCNPWKWIVIRLENTKAMINYHTIVYTIYYHIYIPYACPMSKSGNSKLKLNELIMHSTHDATID